MIVDPSHGTGRRDLVAAAGAGGASPPAPTACMVEVHPDPSTPCATVPQSLTPAVFGEYAERVLDLARWAGKTA